MAAPTLADQTPAHASARAAPGTKPASTSGHSRRVSSTSRARRNPWPKAIRSPTASDHACATAKTIVVESSVNVISCAVASVASSAATSAVARIEP